MQSNLLVFKDVHIYHHASLYEIGLIVLDSLRGLYLFESKEWTYDELKNADIQKAQNQENSTDTLAFDNTQSIIRQKFNELTHNDGVPIFNYLLMENLNADEYEHLNDSFQELLPREKIIFSDSLQSDIFKKLQDASVERNDLASVDNIMGTLFVQYTILDHDNNLHFCSKEQRAFIDTPLEPLTYLNGVHGSGKSNLLLLKSLVETFHSKSKKIIIIKPTLLACDILKKQLLAIIEHAIIEVDLSAIEIITPLELLNRHLLKLKKETITHVEISEMLMKKAFSAADIIMCDDSDQLNGEFIAYLQHIQDKACLVLAQTPTDIQSLQLKTNYRAQHKKINFYQTNPHAKALQIIAKLVARKFKDIVVVSNSLSREKLKDDLASFINKEPHTLESSVPLINQDFNDLLLCNYTDINAIKANHIILMDLCFTSENEIEYAFNLSESTVDVLYEEDCQEIKELRNKYEQSTQE